MDKRFKDMVDVCGGDNMPVEINCSCNACTYKSIMPDVKDNNEIKDWCMAKECFLRREWMFKDNKRATCDSFVPAY